MTNKRVKNKYLCVLLVLLLLVCVWLSGRTYLPAFADTAYTSAIADLQKDPEFNAADYPDKATDYSVNVIQIAEGIDGELFVYTYQPCQATTYLVATVINMSLSESTDGTKLYGLTLINTSGVFGKYKVTDFAVKADSVRYYNITSIYREWIKGVDKGTGNDNTIDEVVYDVGRLYTATTDNGNVTYTCVDVETVKVENKWNSAIVYPDGFALFENKACTSHFVAFSTDKQIDALLEADVTFVHQPYTATRKTYENVTGGDFEYTYGAAKKEKVTLYYDEVVENDGSGYKGEKHVWNRIESVSDFVKKEDLTDAAKAQLANKSWVLRYYESARSFEATHMTETIIVPGLGVLLSETIVKDERTTEVSILRLKFETDGKIYNLGVVDNKQTGHTSANLPFDNPTALPDWAWWVIIAVAAIVAIVLVCIFVPGAINVVILIFKGLWIVISAPFKGIAALVRKIKEKKDNAP